MYYEAIDEIEGMTAAGTSPLQAYEELMLFARERGEAPLKLASHAAVPQSFRADLLHLIRLNFIPETGANTSVESDVLLASFCRHLGAGYFEFDKQARYLLLDNLARSYNREPIPRIHRVATFLVRFIEFQQGTPLSRHDRLLQEYLDVQRWVALAYLNPDAAAVQLADILHCAAASPAARLQMGGLISALSAPLISYPQLLNYMALHDARQNARGEEVRDLESRFHDDEIKVGSIVLRVPRSKERDQKTEKTEDQEEFVHRPNNDAINVYVAYTNKDQMLVDQGIAHLRLLETQRLLTLWVDNLLIDEGRGLDESNRRLAECDAIMLMISADFLASSGYELQMRKALLRQEIPHPIIFPIILRPCHWEQTEIARVQALPRDEKLGVKPITAWESSDEAWVNVTFEIRAAVERIRSRNLELRQTEQQRRESYPPSFRLKDFENDVFISYAHADNEALIKGQEGWIDQFHYALERRLNQLMGAESKVWRDKKLRGNDYFDDLISQKFPRTAILVSILSPRYVRSDWCIKELREFCRATQETGGLRIEDKSRIFKVVKTPIAREEHPPELQELLGYDFYRIDSAGRPREFSIDPRHESYQQFQQKLDDLAYDILETLFFMIPELAKTKARQDPSARGTIYLAETTFDLQEERDEIKREFIRRGTTVLPTRSLPLEAGAFKSLVQEAIEQSDVCVHLIGRHYGVIPEGESRSIVCLQNEIAAETSQKRPLTRIIWLPSFSESPEERQKQFIDYLENEIANQPHVELLKGNMQDLKTVIHDKLGRNESQSTDSAGQSGPVRIYLICDQRDREAVQRLDDYLYEQGYEVILPIPEGDPQQVREDHIINLLRADAALIFYGTANQFWLRRKLQELQKAYGYGRKKNWQAKAVYIGGPTSSEKEQYRTSEAMVIRQQDGFDTSALEPFLAKLKKPT